ncbi:MAG: DUF3276 family protein [Bacteroidales bacterium]|nr:DUF3276 family protein [Bacteroidales bacterium]
MDNSENKDNSKYDQQREIMSSRIRSGRRTYFFDLKSSRTNEIYLTITESKRCYDDKEDISFFEKHKIFVNNYDIVAFHEELGKIIKDMQEQNLLGEKPVTDHTQE